MSHRNRIHTILGLCMLMPSVLLADRGGSVSIPSQRETPEQAAARYYNSGLRQRDKAVKLEKKLAQARDEKSRLKVAKKMTKEFEKAIKSFTSAIKKNPNLFQAHSSLGFALRKTGRFEESLASYDQALFLAPNYPEAIEYQAEAYLGLDKIDDAKSSYLLLFRLDPVKAQKLLLAMQDWVTHRQSSDSGGQPEMSSFAEWVQNRSEIAAQASPEGSTASW